MATLKPCDFEVIQTKIKGGCQSGRRVVPHDSKSELPLARNKKYKMNLESVIR